MQNEQPPIFQVKISNSEPILLEDLALSMKSLSDEYNSFAKKDAVAIETKSVLYVKQITKGSIDIELIELGAACLLFSDFNTIFEFIKHIGWLFNSVLKNKPESKTIDIKTLERLSDIMEPIKKDRNSSISFNIKELNNKGNLYVFNSNEAERIVNNSEALKRESLIEEKDSRTKNNVLLYFEQTSTQSKKQANKGVIESVSKRALNVIFENDNLKEEILFSSENPLTKAYQVDVEILTIDNKPHTYKIKHLHEVFDK